MNTTPTSKLSQGLIGAALVATAIGPVLADVIVPRSAKQHLRNPNWPPHAKFHDAQYVAIGTLSGVHGLRVLLRREGSARSRLATAATIASIPWLGMLAATLFPGTAASDPEFADSEPKLLGLHPQLALAVSVLGAITGAVVTEHTRSRLR